MRQLENSRLPQATGAALDLSESLIHGGPMAPGYPIATIDFEASSFEHDSFPIEVGVALCEAADAPMRCWSTLIRPTGAWSVGGHWSKASQRIHGITREELADGLSVQETVRQLNALLRPIGPAFCDGGDYDRAWLATLVKAAGIQAMFALHDWQHAFGADDAALMHAQVPLHSTPTPHRADAARLLDAILSPANARNCDT